MSGFIIVIQHTFEFEQEIYIFIPELSFIIIIIIKEEEEENIFSFSSG